MTCKVKIILNQKGGVAKTTTSFNIAYALVREGKKVLLVDLDPQASLTVCCGYNPNEINRAISYLMGLITEDKNLPSEEEYILTTTHGIDLIPSNIELAAVEVSLVNIMSREYILKSIIDQLKSDYDYIIIDCPPTLGMLTINALAAGDSVLIPVSTEFLSAKGLEQLLKSIIRVKSRINSTLKIDGILVTMYSERTKLAKEVLSMIQDAYGSQIRIFKSKIPVTVKVGEANLRNQSIIEYDPKSKASQAYLEFTKEVIDIE